MQRAMWGGTSPTWQSNTNYISLLICMVRKCLLQMESCEMFYKESLREVLKTADGASHVQI